MQSKYLEGCAWLPWKRKRKKKETEKETKQTKRLAYWVISLLLRLYAFSFAKETERRREVGEKVLIFVSYLSQLWIKEFDGTKITLGKIHKVQETNTKINSGNHDDAAWNKLIHGFTLAYSQLKCDCFFYQTKVPQHVLI